MLWCIAKSIWISSQNTEYRIFFLDNIINSNGSGESKRHQSKINSPRKRTRLASQNDAPQRSSPRTTKRKLPAGRRTPPPLRRNPQKRNRRQEKRWQEWKSAPGNQSTQRHPHCWKKWTRGITFLIIRSYNFSWKGNPNNPCTMDWLDFAAFFAEIGLLLVYVCELYEWI